MIIKAKSPREFLNQIEEWWEERKKKYQQDIGRFKHIEDTSSEGLRKAVAALTIFGIQEVIYQVEMDLALLRMLVRIDKRIGKLESERGERKEELKGLEEVRDFLKAYEAQRERMEKAVEKMYGW